MHMDTHSTSRSGARRRGDSRPGAGRGRWAAAACILVLECSQVLYDVVRRPDLDGPYARTLVASSAESNLPEGAGRPIAPPGREKNRTPTAAA